MSVQEEIGSEQSNNETNLEEDLRTKEEIIQKLREFSYYLTVGVEKQLDFCLKLLENSPLPKKSNSDAVTAFSTIASPIPYLGKGLSTAIKESETYILNKIDEKNSRVLADLVYYFSDKKEIIRKILIQASTDLFYSFESQFVRLTCDGGSRRAMQKLAEDATNRIFSYLLKIKQNRDISENEFIKAVLEGSSIKNKIGIKSGKTVENENSEKWKTADIFGNVGVFFEENGEYFETEHLNAKVYGYRRAFNWEIYEEFRANWKSEVPSDIPVYTLAKQHLELLYPEIRSYIMEKNIEEKAELDRARKHEAVLEDQQSKQDELLKTFLEKFQEIIKEVAKNYQEISNKSILENINETKELETRHHEHVTEKLKEIHFDVLQTKEGQTQLQHSTDEIKNDICVIKNTQSELINAGQTTNNEQPVTLANLLENELKKLKKEIKKSDIEPKARKELKRFSKKMFGK